MTRFVTFLRGGRPGFGAVTARGFVTLTGGPWPDLKAVIADQALAELTRIAGERPARPLPDDLVYLPPIPNPGKIICVGVNYPDRNAEYKDGQELPRYPSLFVRFPQSFVGHEQALVRPRISRQLDYEGEIALVIGKPGRHIAATDALSRIAGLTLCNEGSVRDWIRHGKFNVTQGKNFDRSGSLGPWLVPYTDESQIADIRLVTRVNGEVRQDDRTSRMVFGFRELIAYISTFAALEPGDIIITGTPTGAGARLDPPRWLQPGDVVEVEAEGLGTLRNTVADEA